MKLLLLSLCLAVAWSAKHTTTTTTTANPLSMEERVQQLEGLLKGVTRQMMMQQFYMEEKIRSDGDSGLKQLRVEKDGTRNYYTASHIDNRFAAAHDHPNYDRTAGMGELLVVMNGVEFRTRHNDYKLRMPSPDSTDYNKIVDIPFPKTPRSVLKKATVPEQVAEMREYFRAFQEQNTTIRDYRPYFRPNLCYLEGAWTTGTKSLNEPFQSDRHAIDADSWFNLMDKIRFTSLTGTKSVDENFAYLPTNIMSVDDKGVPAYVQWNYRIICHPLKGDLPTKYFQQQDDLSFRFPQRMSMNRAKDVRGQRYRMNYQDADHYSNGRSIMDDLMMQVPGKDNYPAKMYDHSFDMVMEDVRYDNHTLVNTGYYHRYFKTLDKGAMGIKSIMRGYNDANLWVAQTTHPEVAPISAESCKRQCNSTTHRCHKVCKTFSSRVSYALPLEVVYLTPLQAWNPYDIAVHHNSQIVTDHNKRNGAPALDTAFNGTYPSKFHFLTPAEFFSSMKSTGPKDPADTAKNGAGVLDKNGDMKLMASSGIRIVMPDIEGVGKIRTRYPIMPLHGEGSGVWKELNALKDMTMHMNRYASLYEERPGMIQGGDNDTLPMGNSATLHFKLSTTYQDPPGEHSHDLYLNEEELQEILHSSGDSHLVFTTSEDMGHSHDLSAFRYDSRRKALIARKCDGRIGCWDGHSKVMQQV